MGSELDIAADGDLCHIKYGETEISEEILTHCDIFSVITVEGLVDLDDAFAAAEDFPDCLIHFRFIPGTHGVIGIQKDPALDPLFLQIVQPGAVRQTGQHFFLFGHSFPCPLR